MSNLKRLIFFGDSKSFITSICFEALLNVLKNEKDIKLVAVVDTSKEEFKQDMLIFHLLRYFIKLIFNPSKKPYFIRYKSFIEISRSKLPSVPILIPENRDINDLNFINKIRSYKPDIALVIGCPQKFSRELLNSFTYCVNYHNSLLPKYRGLYATSVSIYFNEKETGYTFHFMNENFDDGNIIIQGSIPIPDNCSAIELEIRKTIEASKRLNELFELIKADFSGYPQQGEKSYFGKKDIEEYTKVNVLSIDNIEEIKRKLKAFGYIKVLHDGTWVNVTDICIKNNQIKIKRINHLPIWLFRLYKFFKKRS